MTPKLRRRMPLAAFLLVSAIGWGGGVVLWSAAGRTDMLRFAAAADEATTRIRERLRLHLQLINTTAAIVDAQGDAFTKQRFDRYYARLEISDRIPGIAGLGYAPLARADRIDEIAARRLGAEAAGFAVWPEPTEARVAPVLYIGSPDVRPTGAVGFDMFSEPVRRAAMIAALDAGAPRATEPLKLATDEEPRPGFIVYAPIAPDARDDAAVDAAGFVFGGFRIHELADAALGTHPLPTVALTIADADAPDTALYGYGEPSGPSRRGPEPVTRALDVAGQTWTLRFEPGPAFVTSGVRPLAVAFAAISTAAAGAIAMALREQARARDVAEALATATQRNLAERDFLLQEMKHRIKNAIARILAIARQTATQSPDLAAFNVSFGQRLQAMAAAQDMLTQSLSGGADLDELLGRELLQVFGAETGGASASGPPVLLDAARAQALGLVFHELATNALKYGGVKGAAPQIEVRWRLTDGGALELDWIETGGPTSAPKKLGFGARLIDTSIRRELGGEVERDWRPNGLALRLRLPLRTA